MCVVRLCNVALGRYSNIDSKEPETIGGREWKAWYIIGGEVRALEILRKMLQARRTKVRKYCQDWSGEKMATTNMVMTM
jgi:hypothetical protein